jgi:hypothetical protein
MKSAMINFGLIWSLLFLFLTLQFGGCFLFCVSLNCIGVELSKNAVDNVFTTSSFLAFASICLIIVYSYKTSKVKLAEQ